MSQEASLSSAPEAPSQVQASEAPSQSESSGRVGEADIAAALAAAGLDSGDQASGTGSDRNVVSTTPNKGATEKPVEKPGPKSGAWAAFHKEQKAFQAEREAFKTEKAKLEAEFGPVKSKLAAAKEDTIAALEALGYTDPKEFLERLMEDGGRMTPERKQLVELQQWKANQEKREKEADAKRVEAELSAKQQATLDKVSNDIVQTIKNSPQYSTSLVALTKPQEVLQLMDQMTAETGEMPELEDVLAEAETRFDKNFRHNLTEAMANPRARAIIDEIIKSKLPQKPGAASQKQPIKTISSEMRTGTSSRAAEDYTPSRDGQKEFEEALQILEQGGLKVRRR